MSGTGTAIRVVEQSSAAAVSSCERLGLLGFRAVPFVGESAGLEASSLGPSEIVFFGASCDLSIVLSTANALKLNAVSAFTPLIALRETYDLEDIEAAASIGLYEFLVEPVDDAEISHIVRAAIRDAEAEREVRLRAATLGVDLPSNETSLEDFNIHAHRLNDKQSASLSTALRNLGISSSIITDANASATDVIQCSEGAIPAWSVRLAGDTEDLTARSPEVLALRLRFARMRRSNRSEMRRAISPLHAVFTQHPPNRTLIYDHLNRQIDVNRALGRSYAAIGYRVSHTAALPDLHRLVRASDFAMVYDQKTVCLFFSGLTAEELTLISERMRREISPQETALDFKEFLQHEDRAASFLHGLLNQLTHSTSSEAEE